MTRAQLNGIVQGIKYKDRHIHVGNMGASGYYIQVQYMERDVDTGEMQMQHARKWYISPYSTETEVVETVFKAIKTSNEHVLKEHFTYRGYRVYSPHFDVQGRIDLCQRGLFDRRKEE